MKHKKHPPRSVEWYQDRLGIFTASRTSKVITNKTLKISSQAGDLMDQLLSERWSGEPYDLYQSPWMQRGVELEDDGFLAYESLEGIETEPGGFFTNDAGTIGASPDRLVGANGLLELKCPLLPTQIHAARAGDGNADDHRAQIQCQLWVCEREFVDLFSFHPLLILPPKRVYRDEEYIRVLAAVVNTFVEQLEQNWTELIAKYGKPPRQATIAPVQQQDDPMFVSDADLDAIFAAQRREKEQSNG